MAIAGWGHGISSSPTSCQRSKFMKRDRKSNGTFTKTHGQTDGPEYRAWCHMLSRCYNPNVCNYRNYGGRGIGVHNDWRHSFENFYNHIGPRPSKKHTLERIENNTGYQPGNVKWATNLEQSQNRRTTTRLEFNGESLTIRQWCYKTGLSYATLKQRIKKGWSISDAITTVHRSKLKNK